jgi:hypothetical protein
MDAHGLIRRLARDGYLMLAIAFLALRLFQVPPWDQSVDAYAYWSTRDGTYYDGQTAGAMGAYLYSPAFAQLLAPLTWLPWPVFVTVWTAINVAVVWWLLGRWSLPAMLFLPIPFEIVSGNVHLLYAAAIVLGVRASATWALPILTKVTPGIGLAWFAVRREGRPLVQAVVVTGAIVAVSYLSIRPPGVSGWTSSRRLVHAADGRLVPAGLAPRPAARRHRGRRHRRAHRPGLAAAGRGDARPARPVGQLARDPRSQRAALAGTGGQGGRGALAGPAGPRRGAPVTAFRRAWGRLGRALEHPAVMPGIAIAMAVFTVTMVATAMRGEPLIGYDAHAYYQAAALDDRTAPRSTADLTPSAGWPSTSTAPLAQALHRSASWASRAGVPRCLTILLLVSLWWLGRRWTLLLLLFPPVLGELWLGNLNILLGVAVVVGMRWPAAWSFILLTKITPGIGLLWFGAARGALAIAAVATAAIVAVSFVLAPWLWSDFVEASRRRSRRPSTCPARPPRIPLPLRLVVAALLTAWAARTDRAWVLPIAAGLAVPFLWWNAFAVMVAAVPLYAWRPAVRAPAPGPDTAPAPVAARPG